MSSRDAILQRIRSETSQAAPPEPPPVPEVWPRATSDPAALALRFSKELEGVQGEIIRCEGMDDARAKLVDLMDRSEWVAIGAVDALLTRQITTGIPPERIGWVDESWPPARIADLPAGLVAAERLLADTGSCLVACPTGHERLMCYLPPVSVVVAKTSQLAEHMPAAWDDVAATAADPGLTGEHVIVTGPSRTADIEKILILGVHGPKRLVVMLVEGG